jgi:hypothetical protein
MDGAVTRTSHSRAAPRRPQTHHREMLVRWLGQRLRVLAASEVSCAVRRRASLHLHVLAARGAARRGDRFPDVTGEEGDLHGGPGYNVPHLTRLSGFV